MPRYVNIVFLTGDDSRELIDKLYNREGPDSVLYHGAWQKDAHAAAVELAQLDNGAKTYGEILAEELLGYPLRDYEDTANSYATVRAAKRYAAQESSPDYQDESSAGAGDDTWHVHVRGTRYVLSASLGLGYVGLERITRE